MPKQIKCESCSKMHLYSKSHDCEVCLADICDDCEDEYDSCCKQCFMWALLFTDKQTGKCDSGKLFAFLFDDTK